jgi:hypothetical protein
MPYQLRIYTINRGRLDDFAMIWKKSVYPLRLKFGYKITMAQILPETNQFVWRLGYDSGENWEDRERAYYESAERKNMEPDPAQWIARAREHFSLDVLGDALEGLENL